MSHQPSRRLADVAVLALLLAAGAAGCGRRPAPAPTTPAGEDAATGAATSADATAGPSAGGRGDAEQVWRATVRIDPRPGGKKFQGVWLELADGQRWVIDYRPRAVWTDFADRPVRVTGGCYLPFGQAIAATHFRVATLVPDTEAPRPEGWPVVAVGPDRREVMTLIEVTGAAGTKTAGEVHLELADERGHHFLLAGHDGDLPAVGLPVRVRVRPVEPSPYQARLGGAYLHLLGHEPTTSSPEPDRDEAQFCPPVGPGAGAPAQP
ncbi:MAG: hypothetical protein KBG28_04795 [Kofleriaceae bacterium]|nr:hypothetical protein [Kofleriaceae bacterium]